MSYFNFIPVLKVFELLYSCTKSKGAYRLGPLRLVPIIIDSVPDKQRPGSTVPAIYNSNRVVADDLQRTSNDKHEP